MSLLQKIRDYMKRPGAMRQAFLIFIGVVLLAGVLIFSTQIQNLFNTDDSKADTRVWTELAALSGGKDRPLGQLVKVTENGVPYLYAIGGNEEASRLSGVPVVTAKIFAYLLSGLFAAVAGICQAAQEQQGDPEAGVGYELIAIAMVVIGGTNLMGGRGGMGLTLLGVLTIGYLDKILSINAVPEAGRLMMTGVIIVVAVLTQRRSRS